METTPLPGQQQQQSSIYQVSASNGSLNHGSGSVGPFFAVISVIMVLAALSCVLGKVCAGRLDGADSKYKCPSCGCERLCALGLLVPDIRYDCWDWFRRRCCCCLKIDSEV